MLLELKSRVELRCTWSAFAASFISRARKNDHTHLVEGDQWRAGSHIFCFGTGMDAPLGVRFHDALIHLNSLCVETR